MSLSLASHGTAAHGHDEGGRDALAGDIRDGNPKVIVIHREVIEVVAAQGAGRKVQSADFKTREIRSIGGEEDLLDLTGDLEIVIHGVLLPRFEIDRLIEQGKGRLFQNRLKEISLRLAKWLASPLFGDGQHPENFLPVVERAQHHGFESLGNEGCRKLMFFTLAGRTQQSGLLPGADLSEQCISHGDGLKPQETLDGLTVDSLV